MDLELIVKTMGKLSNTLDLDDYIECTQVFAKYIQKKVTNVIKDMPHGANYTFLHYDKSTQILEGEYDDENLTLRVKIPVDCRYVDVNQIIDACETPGYVVTIETIQKTQENLKKVIMDAIAPVARAIKELKGE